MDTNTVIVITIIVFAIVIIATLIRYRKKGSADITGPLGMKLSVTGENPDNGQKAGIKGRAITSHEGGLSAEETTGQGIDLEQVDVKNDVILSSSRQQEVEKEHQEFVRPSLVYANGLNAGGDIQIFLNDLGLGNHRFSQFATSQFEAYNNIWKKLQALRVAGDNLWEKVSTDNLYEFGQHLRQVKMLALEGDIYIEDEHREKLKDVLYSLGQFYFGKQRLSEIREKEEIEYYMRKEYVQEEIRENIEHNRRAKKQYERLLEEIRVGFRNKLSKL